MRAGANWPYDSFPQAPDATRDTFLRLHPDSVIIMSHAAEADYEWLMRVLPNDGEITVRAKTGPGHLGTYPSDILDYREWDSERSLRDTLELLQAHGKPLRVILGNEPDLEMIAGGDVNNHAAIDLAIDEYMRWFTEESATIRSAFPDVQISPAPVSQGDRWRSLRWRLGLTPAYMASDFTAVHCYIPIGGEPADWSEQWKWYRAAFPTKPVAITEVNDNGTYGSLNDVERAQRYGEYITQVAQSGMVDEVDVFTLPGGAGDASAPSWWFITPEMAEVIGAAERMPVIAVPPVEEPVAINRTDDDAILECRRILWLAINPGLDFNPDTALYKYWAEHIAEMGSPVGPELPGADNRYQSFARGVWRWLNDGQNTVEKVAA